MRLCPLPLLLAATLLPAQEPMPYLATSKGTDHGWTGEVGAGIGNVPAYLGSDQTRTTLLPVLALEYNHRFFIGSSFLGIGFGAGAHLVDNGGFTWDLGLSVGDRRPESRAPLLAGMGDRSADVFADTGVHYRLGGFQAGAILSHGLRDDAGNRATVSLRQGLPLADRWRLGLGLHATWADTDAMDCDFGITPGQAASRAALAASGAASFTPSQIGPYSPSAGMRDAGAGVSLSYRSRPRITWTAACQEGVLLGDARNSPLAARNTYQELSAGFAYRF